MRCFFAALFALLALLGTSAAQQVEVVNNHDFDIAMPWKLLDGRTVMVDVNGSGKQTIHPATTMEPAMPKVIVEPVHGGVHFMSDKQDRGTLQWDVVVDQFEKEPTDVVTGRDFPAGFTPLAMKFAKAGGNKWVTTLSGEASKAGVRLRIELDAYANGYIDIRGTFVNESAPTTKVYAAVITRWTQQRARARSVNYNNEIRPLEANGSTSFREGGGEPRMRHLMIQRGVDWLNCTFDKASVAWLNDFSPSFTVHHEQRGRTPPRWVGANIAQLGQEALIRGDALYSITEIARPNIRMYASRLDDNVLPGQDEPLTFTSRLIISDDKLTDKRVDELFIAYTGFNPQTKSGDTTTLTFGVPHVKFGTAYFPYSTLGENFEKWHMPGQSKETYWPLSADTVTHYELFADDIKRDLRIAKAMGFETIRLHHLEEIAALDEAVQDQYLDFFFFELKRLGLTALLDVKLPAERIVELVEKYRPQVDGVEIDNEVLIFGINDADIPYWKDVYAAVKKVAPDLPVWLTGHTNTGAFERIRKLGVPFDKVGMHAYLDSIEAIPSSRDYALAVANYASEIGKSPCITEWNWRFLTRMTPEARAEIYPPIFETVLKTRCMPLIYQFQFQESLAMSSKSLRGIRHYEQLNLSRRPRPEAVEFMKLIDRYSSPTAPNRQIAVNRPVVEVKDREGEAQFTITNTSDRTIELTITEEATEGLQIANAKNFGPLKPGEKLLHNVGFFLSDNAEPGFYHLFVRMAEPNGIVRYAWAEVRNPGSPKIEKGESKFHPEVSYGEGALDYDFNRDIAIVYGDGREHESRWDVESAWLIYQTLESATGRPVKIFQLKDLPPELRESGNLILVGTLKDHALISERLREPPKGSWVARKDNTLIVGGDDEAKLNVAAIDLVLRYWMHAKDSGARRIALTDKPIQKGADPSVLP